jgi:hypothetical protein
MDVVTREVEREEPESTETAFTRLLEWLDDGIDSGGETYLEMRRRLVANVDRRNRPAADALADETFDRISRTLETSSIAVTPPARYCYVIARFVLLEDIRRERRSVPFDETRSTIPIEFTAGAHAADAPQLSSSRGSAERVAPLIVEARRAAQSLNAPALVPGRPHGRRERHRSPARQSLRAGW